ncbi:VOC family protein [Rhodococcus wratislaviensis]|uniref:VOC domain-containing protein n=1 Tax=Rhodococcus wratislaviensis NBRC 100605 TaxID=1219028 RepID=X0PM89_RHOWR|nr:VOC family protein [Rhodococcus wratislaviensis]GAF43654.1 hypothetical protein RW1_009_00780 [Rhodococcus wratislaviensis NBRC 100605]
MARGVAAFSHIAVSVSNLDLAADFYCSGLGFGPGDEYSAAGCEVAAIMGVPRTGFRGTFLRLGVTLLELLEYREALPKSAWPRDPREVGYAHISLIVPDMHEAVDNALRHGGAFCAQLDHAFGGGQETTITFLRDPDGNRIELIFHPNSEETRAHSNFLGIGAIGWPADVV